MSKQQSAISSASKSVDNTQGRLGHWFRIAMCLISMGILYPNAMTEGMDLTKIQGETEGDLYKKK